MADMEPTDDAIKEAFERAAEPLLDTLNDTTEFLEAAIRRIERNASITPCEIAGVIADAQRGMAERRLHRNRNRPNAN